MRRKTLSTETSTRILADFAHATTLPSERLLADKYACARGTIRSALALLKENGSLKSSVRNGHVLQHQGNKVARKTADSGTPLISLVTVGKSLADGQHMDMIAGAIHQASLEKMNCLMCELSQAEQIDTLTHFRDLHPGSDIAGYLVTGNQSSRLRRVLASSVRPCVMSGSFYEEELIGRNKFLQVHQSTEMAYSQAARHLVSLGHKRVLLVFSSFPETGGVKEIMGIFRRVFAEAGLSEDGVDCVAEDIWETQESFSDSAKRQAHKVMKSLRPEHTAVVATSGGRSGFRVWQALQESGRKIPEDLSVIIASGRQDLFAEVFDIGTIYANAWDEGAACVRELARQIRSRRLESGVKYTDVQYLTRSTVGPARANETK